MALIKNIRYRQIILFVTVSVVILAVFTTLFFGFLSIKNDFYEYITSTQTMLLKQTALKIEDTISTAEIISNMYYYNPSIATIIHTNSKYLDDHSRYSYYLEMKGIDEQLETALINSDLSYKCIMISDNGFTYNSAARISDYRFEQYMTAKWDTLLEDSKGSIVLVTPYEDESADSTWYWSFARVLKSNATYKPIGRLFINIDERTVFDLYKNLSSEQNDLFILNEEDTIISSSSVNSIGTVYPSDDSESNNMDGRIQDIDGISYLILSFPIEHTQLYIVEHIPLTTVLSPFRTAICRILICCVVITIILIFLARMLTSKAVLPFNQLYTSLSKFGSGDLNVTFPPSKITEFQQINSICNVTVGRINNLIDEIQEKEEQKRIAEIQALQSQIRPHFLNNTLFTIKCMIDLNKNETALAMLKHLSALLKYLQHNQDILATVAEEIEELKQYVAIMSYRYPDAFTVDFIIDPQVSDNKILRHLLQPLVENSIFHGIGTDESINHITIAIRLDDDLMTISVSDTGCGIDPQKLARLFHTPEHHEQTGPACHHEQVGLYNIKERLLLYFHMPDPITVTSVPYERTEFIIKHPIIRDEVNTHAKDSYC